MNPNNPTPQETCAQPVVPAATTTGDDRPGPESEGPKAPTTRFHMRIVNGGTPERIESRDAVREMTNAQIGEDRKGVREMSASGGHARIVYKDVRGTVVLRPATGAESAMPWKPEKERYAPGDHVIVRGVYYRPETRTHHVLPEYEGVVVNWYAGHYNVRAVEADEYGEGGVRQCRVRELRPLPPTADDVIEAPHSLYVSGQLRHEGISADRVRRIVGILRFQKKVFTQDPADRAIVVENRRYVPQPTT